MIVVSGAGPTGLTAALALAASGCQVRVVECRPEPVSGRFQAVVLDRQTLVTFNRLGISDAFVTPISQARFIDRQGNVQGSVRYSDYPENLDGNCSSDLAGVLDRREVVGMAAIDDITAALLAACQDEPGIVVSTNSQIDRVTPRGNGLSLRIATSGRTERINARQLLIADGAQSDSSGALRSVGIRKVPLAAGLDILLSRFTLGQAAAGEIRVRTTAHDSARYSAAFGLAGDVMVYTSGRHDNPEQAAQQTARRLGLADAQLIGVPVATYQQVRSAAWLNRGNSVLVIGDAGYSGTAILGVYLNKGIADAIAAAEVCLARGERAQQESLQGFARRASNLALAQVTLEEQLLSVLHHMPMAGLPPSDLVDTLFGLAPRLAFRMKLRRNSRLTSSLINTVDIAATTAQAIATMSPNNSLSGLARLSAELLAHSQRFLEPDVR